MMFDRLIESEPESAQFRSRRSFFMVSSLVVALFFGTAVVVSLYAADISLGSDELVLSTMVAPPELPAEKPEVERPRPARQAAAITESQVPVRQMNMASVEESQFVPGTTSVVRNKNLERPKFGEWKIDPNALESNSHSNSGPARGSQTGSEFASKGLSDVSTAKADVRDPEPPPAVKSSPPKAMVSEGVINGKATSLPVPIYPAPAKAVGADGKVDVQVIIDEDGKVISATAVNGHPLLRAEAVKAAWRAKFSPTYLSRVPVKVTGVIVYNFTR